GRATEREARSARLPAREARRPPARGPGPAGVHRGALERRDPRLPGERLADGGVPERPRRGRDRRADAGAPPFRAGLRLAIPGPPTSTRPEASATRSR